MLIKTKFADDPSVKDAKVVFTLFDDKFEGTLDPAFPSKLDMLEIPRTHMQPSTTASLSTTPLCASLPSTT